jgi:hypothetical protein
LFRINHFAIHHFGDEFTPNKEYGLYISAPIHRGLAFVATQSPAAGPAKYELEMDQERFFG